MKKVTFSPHIIVHQMVTWKFAYKTSRVKYWEQIATDRMRFQRRINELAHIIEPILNCNYRLKVYNERIK